MLCLDLALPDVLGVGGVLVALALGVVFFGTDETDEVAPQTQSIKLSSQPADELSTTTSDNVPAPQFDAATPDSTALDTYTSAESALSIEIARVKPDGAAVVAGSAPVGAAISVFENKILLGKTTADANGELSLIHI